MEVRQLQEPGNTAIVTQMRQPGEANANHEFANGNMLPRLCEFAGAGACASVCQRAAEASSNNECAEQNITTALAEADITPERFVMVGATRDAVGFGDQLWTREVQTQAHEDGYHNAPGYNAFFFRPGIDAAPNGDSMTHIAMRMADCGAVYYEFPDKDGNSVVGLSHFSRTNMFGPSAYAHERNGQKVSWGEFVLGNAIDHYGADPATVKITLVAAVEGKDFIHKYKDMDAMRGHFKGWEELGFMHPQGTTDFDCLIDYREMIAWQLTESIQDANLRPSIEQVDLTGVINTGDLHLGFASHHHATKKTIPHGRDMYIAGFDLKTYVA